LLHDSTADAIVEHALFLALIVGAVVVAADAVGAGVDDVGILRGVNEIEVALRIERVDGGFQLVARDSEAMEEVLGHDAVRRLTETDDAGDVWVAETNRGSIKQTLIKIGFPVEDRGGYVEGDPFPVQLREETLAGEPFGLRPYQSGAAESFYRGGSVLRMCSTQRAAPSTSSRRPVASASVRQASASGIG